MSMGFRMEDLSSSGLEDIPSLGMEYPPVCYGDLSSFEDPSMKHPPPPYDENWVEGGVSKRKPAEEKPAKRMPAKAAKAVAKRKRAKRMPAKRMPAKGMPAKGMPVKKVSWETPDKIVELFEFIKSHPIQPADRVTGSI